MAIGPIQTPIPATSGKDTSQVQGSNTFSAAGTATLVAAPAAGLRLYFNNIVVTNADASNGGTVTILGNARVIHVGFASANGGGYALRCVQLKEGEALKVTMAGSTTSLIASADGYIKD